MTGHAKHQGPEKVRKEASDPRPAEKQVRYGRYNWRGEDNGKGQRKDELEECCRIQLTKGV